MSFAPKLSIITAIHNALPMNRLFWRALVESTVVPFELILVDNKSDDGSEKFFAELARSETGDQRRVLYLRNDEKKSYPVSQNQGMRAARSDIFCFLNNDVWMPHGWHHPFELALEKNPLQVLSPSGQEAQPYQKASDKLKRKWKRVQLLSKAAARVLGWDEEKRLWTTLRWMYGDLKNFRSPTPQVHGNFPGIKGDSVIFHRRFLENFPGVWDERFQAADWHLYMSVADRHEREAAFPLPKVLVDSYIHHFGRYSIKKLEEGEHYTQDPRIQALESHWSRDRIQKLWWGNRLPEKL